MPRNKVHLWLYGVILGLWVMSSGSCATGSGARREEVPYTGGGTDRGGTDTCQDFAKRSRYMKELVLVLAQQVERQMGTLKFLDWGVVTLSSRKGSGMRAYRQAGVRYVLVGVPFDPGRDGRPILNQRVDLDLAVVDLEEERLIASSTSSDSIEVLEYEVPRSKTYAEALVNNSNETVCALGITFIASGGSRRY